MIIRKAKAEDALAIEKIEKECIKRPWPLTLIKADLESNPNATYYVAEDSEIIGFLGVHNIVGEINITNIAVAGKYRKQGAANLLMTEMLNEFSDRKKKGEDIIGVTLEVRVSNEPAIKLYEKFGFTTEGIRKGYYSDGEDALIMWNKKL